MRTENQSERMNFCWVQSAESELNARIPHGLHTDSEHPLCEDLGHVGNLPVRAESVWSPRIPRGLARNRWGTVKTSPICTLPKPTITLSNGDVAPSVRTPATRMPTEPHARTLSIVHGPHDLSRRHSHIHPPRDLSALRSSTPNPWGSLRRRHYGCDPHAPRQFPHCRQHRQKYPVNTYVHTTPIPKPPAPTPTCIFETVRHPRGIGPNKPVIQVPTRMTGDTPAHHAQRMDRAIVKPATPLPPSHSIAAIRCQCGQFVPVSNTLQLSPSPLHHTLSTFISHFISRPLSLPAQFFSRFMFS